MDIGQPLGELGTLAVEFDWPFEVANGKWLLYLTEIVVSGQSKMECTPPEVINPLNVSYISVLCFNCDCNYNLGCLITIHVLCHPKMPF